MEITFSYKTNHVTWVEIIKVLKDSGLCQTLYSHQVKKDSIWDWPGQEVWDPMWKIAKEKRVWGMA
jgi:hypothetical protein